uniref:Uncharacterized protein n=1 Tax=Romanomermis culicivorax TaxID=13658 RepID=A0A915HPN1_ROMCU
MQLKGNEIRIGNSMYKLRMQYESYSSVSPDHTFAMAGILLIFNLSQVNGAEVTSPIFTVLNSHISI